MIEDLEIKIESINENMDFDLEEIKNKFLEDEDEDFEEFNNNFDIELELNN